MGRTVEPVDYFNQNTCLVIENFVNTDELSPLRQRTDNILSGETIHVALESFQFEEGMGEGESSSIDRADRIRMCST